PRAAARGACRAGRRTFRGCRGKARRAACCARVCGLWIFWVWIECGHPAPWIAQQPIGWRDSTPLCPAGHLPRKGGDWQLRRRRPQSVRHAWKALPARRA
ncbi:MAG: hypothetical protein EOQ64_30845, partial [Mesorhizobium sp.]